MKSALFLALGTFLISSTSIAGNLNEDALARSGCCSWHGGVCGCSFGSARCCDGTTSPSCGCLMDSKDDPFTFKNSDCDPEYDLAQGSHYVQPYTRSNGTYVPGHYQTNPNSSTYDNWSTKGNTNPYTGEKGSKDPYSSSFGSSNNSNSIWSNHSSNSNDD